MLSQTVELLRLARSLIAEPSAWCKGTNAERNVYEHEREHWHSPRIWCSYDDPAACAWCANGALELARIRLAQDGKLDEYTLGADVTAEACQLLDRAAYDIRPGLNVSAYSALVALNDHPDSTHSDVLGMFDAAIECATPREVLA